MHQQESLAKEAIKKRIRARELAFQAIFQYDVQASGDKVILDIFLKDGDDDEPTIRLAKEWTFGTIDNTEQIDLELTSVIKNWKTTALMPVERAILRLSMYQFLYCSHIPCKVVVNEAIEIAKKYSTENSPGFVNGILDAVLKKQNVPQESPQK
jgi:transcription antitermination protein NusB